MEERIIKKTVELIYKDINRLIHRDINRKVLPLLLWVRSVIRGFISGASIVLLNRKGYQVYKYFDNKESQYEFSFNTSTWVSTFLLTIFFFYKILSAGKMFILLLLISHSIGLIFTAKDYIINKQQQAIDELDQKNNKEKESKVMINQKRGINK